LITSAGNPRLKLVRRLASRRQRERLGLFVAEGEDLVEAALRAGLMPTDVLVDAERPALTDRLAEFEEVASPLLRAMSTLAHPPRVVAVFRSDDLPRLRDTPAPEVGLALWHVSDPGNVGTLVRSADAFGPAFVALSSGCADLSGPKALRAAAGSTFRVPTGRFDAAPGRRLALVAHGGTPLEDVDLDGPLVFVLGAERAGLPAEVVERCDEAVTIPVGAGVDSLNVAVAGGLALYEYARRRAIQTMSSPPR
jgi:TrmH family RNA methyltransferase